MSARTLWRRLIDALRGHEVEPHYTSEHMTFITKQAELEARIRHLESETYGPNGLSERLGYVERRQADDPCYAGPERRASRHTSH